MTDNVCRIVPGDIVSSLEPNELVDIQRIAPFGSKKLVEGVKVRKTERLRELDLMMNLTADLTI